MDSLVIQNKCISTYPTSHNIPPTQYPLPDVSPLNFGSQSPISNICQNDAFSPQSPISDICQLDGIDDIVPHVSPPPHHITGGGLGPRTHLPQQTGNVRTASYNLNRKKQVTKLVTDASVQDYDIIVSPTEQNINVECSTGFYSLVVLPAFSAIFVGFSTTAANTDIQCYDITNKVDNSKSHVNTVLFFKLNTPNTSRSNNVTITLHHTARKVQVQGSSNINGNIRANVWFLQNVLLGMFSSLSATKAMDITKFNIMVQNVVTNHMNKRRNESKCSGCDISFTNRSQYEQCSSCNNHYHKKCITTHLCGAAAVFQPSSNILTPSGPNTSQAYTVANTVPATSSSSWFSTPASTNHPLPMNTVSMLGGIDQPMHLPPSIHHAQPAHHTPTYPAGSARRPSHPNSGSDQVTSQQADQVDHPHQPGSRQQDDQPDSLGHPHPPDNLGSAVHVVGVPTTTVSTSITTALPSRPASKNKTRSNTKHIPATNNASFEIECHKKQIAVAKAKIQELEAENVKLNKTNHILGERIKMFENRQEKEMFDSYFTTGSAHVPPSSDSLSQPEPTSKCQTHHCCPPPPCYVHHHCPQTRQDNGVLRNMMEQINTLQLVVNGLKSDIAALPRSLPADNHQGPSGVTTVGPALQPLSPVIATVMETPENQHTPDGPANDTITLHDISTSSTNTIEEHVEVTEQHHLNSKALTSQFPQLMQQSPPQ